MLNRLFKTVMGLLLLLVGTGTQVTAHADPAVQALDSEPGASLLFPYFEADLASANGRDTMISFHNASATAVLEHITFWTDMGVPVLTFNAYLTGYDVASFSVRDVLVNGNLPRTASAGQDPSDTISNKGPLSQDINFASCTGQLPYPNAVLNAAFRADLASSLTGGPSIYNSNKCVAAAHGDSIARGYITMDTVNNCTARTPGDPGYFGGIGPGGAPGPSGSGDTTNQNVVAGEYFIVDAAHLLLHQDQAVPLTASAVDPATSISGNYTFYGRRTGWTAVDNREALPTTWAVDAQAAGTQLIVWRDTKINVQPFTCSTAPAGLPLGQESAFSFDNQERPSAGGTGQFGLATQRVTLGGGNFPLPAKAGWVYLGLSSTQATSSNNAPQDPAAAQAYVTVVQYPESKQNGSTGAQAFALDTAQAARHTHPDSP